MPDKKAFLDAVTRAVTKGAMENYYNPGLSWKETEGYSVGNILKMLSGNKGYRETHNAIFDAEDELQVMQLLGHELSKYDVALLSDHKISRTCKM